MATLTVTAGNTYYLVVPNNEYYEGCYGWSTWGAEIPPRPTRCYPQAATIGYP